VSQVRITRGDNFGLWPQSARRPGGSLCAPLTCPLHLWNYTRRFIVNLNSDEVLCRKSALRVFVIGAMFS
jgi:hypothetical protein